jgi:hypothetical protein
MKAVKCFETDREMFPVLNVFVSGGRISSLTKGLFDADTNILLSFSTCKFTRENFEK